MTDLRRFAALFACFMTAGLSSCQMNGAAATQSAEPVIARLPDTSPETLDLLKDQLADALGTARIEFGAGDLSQDSIITVLPPPLGSLDTRSPSAPEAFDIRMDDKSCFLIRRKNNERIDLDGITCLPVV